MLLRDLSFSIAFDASDRLAALLAHPEARKIDVAPPGYAYEPIATAPPFGSLLGAVGNLGRVHRLEERFELYKTESGCGVRGVLRGGSLTMFQMNPGGVIATVPRQAERFPGASAFGEWQPSLRDTDGLRARWRATRRWRRSPKPCSPPMKSSGDFAVTGESICWVLMRRVPSLG